MFELVIEQISKRGRTKKKVLICLKDIFLKETLELIIF